MADMYLSEKELSNLEQRLAKLSEQGVAATEQLSGELNMSGCASSSCMAWD